MRLTEKDKAALDALKKRRALFDQVCAKLWKSYGEPWETFNCCTCPVCGYPTLWERGNYDLCEICDWEDEGQDDGAEEEKSGPNLGYTVLEARLNFARFGGMYGPEDGSDFERLNEQAPRSATLRRLLEGLLEAGGKKDLDERVLAIKRLQGWATTLEEYLSCLKISYESRKGLTVDDFWFSHPVWEGTTYHIGLIRSPERCCEEIERRFHEMQHACERLGPNGPRYGAGGFVESDGFQIRLGFVSVESIADRTFLDRRPCLACGLPTLCPGGGDACRICGWNKDSAPCNNPDKLMGGPKGGYSLTEARINFSKHLAIFRPGDEPFFGTHQENILKKCLLIRKYVALEKISVLTNKELKEIRTLETLFPIKGQ